MNLRSRAVLFLSSSFIAASLAACAVAPGPDGAVVVAPYAPPPPRVEVVPPPGARAEAVYWQPGRWHWNGHEWQWREGHYAERPHRAAVWEPGHWAQRGNQWVWLEGRWR